MLVLEMFSTRYLSRLAGRNFFLGTRNMSSSEGYIFETLKVTPVGENVLQVEMNRPEKRNAMNRYNLKALLIMVTLMQK